MPQGDAPQRRDRVRADRADAADRRDRARARSPRAAGRQPRTSLTRAQVVAAAVHVLETDGYPALSMRRVAQQLDVGTMSLYWHVADRDELLDLVFDHVVGEQMLTEIPADWREGLRQIAHGSRAMFDRYPWIVDIGPRDRIGAAVLEHVEQSIAATESMGLPMVGRLAAVSLVDHYVLGFVLQDHTRPQGEPDLTDEAQRELDAGRYPQYAAFAADHPAATGDWDDAQGFEVGLELVLAGIATMVESGAVPGSTTAAPATRPSRTRRKKA